LARKLSSEMHSGFANLRKNLSMNFLKKNLKFKKNRETLAEITRAKNIIENCLKKIKDHLCLKNFLL
jgi:hypothetical protein